MEAFGAAAPKGSQYPPASATEEDDAAGRIAQRVGRLAHRERLRLEETAGVCAQIAELPHGRAALEAGEARACGGPRAAGKDKSLVVKADGPAWGEACDKMGKCVPSGYECGAERKAHRPFAYRLRTASRAELP